MALNACCSPNLEGLALCHEQQMSFELTEVIVTAEMWCSAEDVASVCERMDVSEPLLCAGSQKNRLASTASAFSVVIVPHGFTCRTNARRLSVGS